MKEWNILRSIAFKMCRNWADRDEIDDIASDALLMQYQRGSSGYRAVVDALRYRYGRSNTVAQYKRWHIRNALSLIRQDEDNLSFEHKDNHLSMVDADDLADHLSVACPSWVALALKLVVRGHSLSAAARACGRTYDTLYTHLYRMR